MEKSLYNGFPIPISREVITVLLEEVVLECRGEDKEFMGLQWMYPRIESNSHPKAAKTEPGCSGDPVIKVPCDHCVELAAVRWDGPR